MRINIVEKTFEEIDYPSWVITTALCENKAAAEILEMSLRKTNIFHPRKYNATFIEVMHEKLNIPIGRITFYAHPTRKEENWVGNLWIDKLFRRQGLAVILLEYCSKRFGEYHFSTSNLHLLDILRWRIPRSEVYGTQEDFSKLGRTQYLVKIPIAALDLFDSFIGKTRSEMQIKNIIKDPLLIETICKKFYVIENNKRSLKQYISLYRELVIGLSKNRKEEE